MTDITKIDDAETADTMGVDRFASAMKAKLDEKRMQGYEGWNNDCTVERLEKLMLKHVEKPWDARNLTDIANFCMMLWNRANPTATAARPEEKDTAWLIEMPAARWGAGYFWIGLVEYRTWGSVEEAVRFSRKDDAERVIASLHQQDERRYGYKQELKYEACEHQWPSSPRGTCGDAAKGNP